MRKPDSIFDLASLTKVYTTLLVLQLADQGKIDLLKQRLARVLEYDADAAIGAIEQ